MFNFIFYCLFKMFALVKRQGVKNESLATSYYAVLVGTNIVSVIVIVNKHIPVEIYSKILSIILVLLLFVLLQHLFGHYFLLHDRFKQIISKYSLAANPSQMLYPIIGILYSVLTFLIFYLSVL